MPTFELSFTPTFYYESLDLPRHVSKAITRKLEILASDPYSARGDAKKLKGYDNVYRVRVGDYRICYCIGRGWVKLLRPLPVTKRLAASASIACRSVSFRP